MGGFVVTMVYGFSRPTGDLDALEIIPKAAGLALLELGMQGGPLHKKYKIYLDRVGVAKVPEDYESRLAEISRRRSSTFGYSLLIPTILRYQSWNEISRETETMSSTWREPFLLIWMFSKHGTRRNFVIRWAILSVRTSPCGCGLKP